MTSDQQNLRAPAAPTDELKAVWVLGHRGDIAPVLAALGPLVPDFASATSAESTSEARVNYARVPGEPYFASIDLERSAYEERTLNHALDLCFAIVRAKDLPWWKSSPSAAQFVRLAYRRGGILVIGDQGATTEGPTMKHVCDHFGWPLESAPVYLSSAPIRDAANDPGQRGLRTDLEHTMLMALHRRRCLYANEDAEFGAWCHGTLQWKVLTDIWLRSAWELQAEVAIPRTIVNRALDTDVESAWNRVLHRTHCAIHGALGEAPYLGMTKFRELYESSYRNASLNVVSHAKGSGDERTAARLALFTVALGIGYASLLREEEPVYDVERLLLRLVVHVRQASKALAMMPQDRSLGNLGNNPFVRKNGHRIERSNNHFWKYFDVMLELPELNTRPNHDEPPAELLELVRASPEGLAFTAEDLTNALQGELPVTGGSFSIEVGSTACVADAGALKATLWFVRVGTAAGGQTERDVCEQQVTFVPERHLNQPARVRAYVKGWAAAVLYVLPRLRDDSLLMLSNFVDPSVLHLLRANTADDFRRAFLVKARLGRLVQKEPSKVDHKGNDD